LFRSKKSLHIRENIRRSSIFVEYNRNCSIRMN
jgi:hypothetical protein